MIHDFEYFWSTRLVFGDHVISKVASKIKADGAHTVMLHYGRGEYLESTGLLPELREGLKAEGLKYVECGGVVPNPRASLVRKGIQMVKDEGVDYILAIGGGSAFDSAKGISVGLCSQADVWDLFSAKEKVESYSAAIPISCIVTYPATGSEAGWATVIRNEEVKEKWSLFDQQLRPHYAFLDPQYTMTLPRHLLVNGICDMMSHHTDRYMCDDVHFGIFDTLLESTMHYLHKDLAPVILDPEKDNLTDRRELMAVADMGCDEWIAWGRHKENASHNIAHQIGALYDTIHGSTLSIIYCSWLSYVLDSNPARIARWAERVWEIEPEKNDDRATALKGIEALRNWYKALGMPVCFADLDIHPTEEEICKMAELSVEKSNGVIGTVKKLYAEDVANILRNSL